MDYLDRLAVETTHRELLAYLDNLEARINRIHENARQMRRPVLTASEDAKIETARYQIRRLQAFLDAEKAA